MSVKTLPVSDLQPGMVLAQGLTDNKGRTIVPSGARLTPMTINRLTKWQITEVRVQTDEETTVNKPKAPGKSVIESASDEERELMRNIAEMVAKRFRNLPESDINTELRRVAIRHLVTNGRGVVPGL